MIIWICGLSAAGKTIIGGKLASVLRKKNKAIVFLDGDVLREIWADNLGHTLEARNFNANRISHLCRMLDRQRIHVVASLLYPFPEWMAWNRKKCSQYFEVFLDVPMTELEARDPKGLYAGARAGKIKNVVGVDLPFTRPENPDLILENVEPFRDPEDLAQAIIDALPGFIF